MRRYGKNMNGVDLSILTHLNTLRKLLKSKKQVYNTFFSDFKTKNFI